MTKWSISEQIRSPVALASPTAVPGGPIFTSELCPHADLAPLIKEVGVRTFSAGATLQFDGDEALHVMIIKSGSVRICKQTADGRRAVVGFLSAGDFIGLAALEVYSSSVEALEPVQVWRFPRAAFRQQVSRCPLLEASILLHVTSDLEAAQGQMLLLSRKAAIERLATFVLQLAYGKNEDTSGRIRAIFHMTRTDMADFLGLTTETVSRCFTRLRRAGLLYFECATVIVLLNRPKLEDVAGGGASFR